jgi:hypothetical protein
MNKKNNETDEMKLIKKVLNEDEKYYLLAVARLKEKNTPIPLKEVKRLLKIED